MFSLTNRTIILALSLNLAIVPAVGAQNTKKKELPKIEGRLIVEDGGGLFSPEAIKKAKSYLSDVRSVHVRELEVVTFKGIPESKKAEFEKLKGEERSKFYADWAHEEAKSSKARGVFVFICRSPGHIVVMGDKQIRDQGFAASDEQRIRDLFLDKFRESTKMEKEDEKQAARDKGLLNAAEYVRDMYNKMTK